MSEKRIDDESLEEVTGAGGDVGLNQDLQTNPDGGPSVEGVPGSGGSGGGGGGADMPEGEGGGGGTQDLEI